MPGGFSEVLLEHGCLPRILQMVELQLVRQAFHEGYVDADDTYCMCGTLLGSRWTTQTPVVDSVPTTRECDRSLSSQCCLPSRHSLPEY